MELDFDKFFKNKKESNNSISKSMVGCVMPGFFFTFVFLFPTLLIYILFCNVLIDFFVAHNLIILNIALYIFLIFSMVISIFLEIRQPFSTMNNRQSRNGRILRGLTQFIFVVYVGIMLLGAYLILGDMSHYSVYSDEYCSLREFLWFLQ